MSETSRRNEEAGLQAGLFRIRAAAFGAMALLSTALPVQAGALTFTADLSGAGEAPPNKSSGKAHLEARLDAANNTLAWTVTYSGLSGAPVGAHFHGPIAYIGLTPEENAPIQIGTPGSLASPFKGSTVITDGQKKDLKDGRWYFNIHTPAFPAGEVRGPVVRQ